MHHKGCKDNETIMSFITLESNRCGMKNPGCVGPGFILLFLMIQRCVILCCYGLVCCFLRQNCCGLQSRNFWKVPDWDALFSEEPVVFEALLFE